MCAMNKCNNIWYSSLSISINVIISVVVIIFDDLYSIYVLILQSGDAIESFLNPLFTFCWIVSFVSTQMQRHLR